MIRTPIAREGYIYIGVLAVITVLSYKLNVYWSIVPGTLLLFVTFFFRNPERTIPDGSDLVVSPADGRVMSICDVFDDEFLQEEGIKISIFLSIFDVHVNRSPIGGEIKYQRYTCGRFCPAFKEVAACENERHSLGIENQRMRVLVTQVAGILARRIVSWVTLGSVLARGQRYGMIKFGSCTEVIVPKSVTIMVKKGDKVKGGETIIGRLES